MKQEFVFNFETIIANKEVQTYLKFTDNAFAQMGYKEHGSSHALRSAEIAEQILKYLDYSPKEQMLAKIAGYLHDIGNVISKHGHDQSGAVMFLNLVDDKRYNEDVFAIASAIGSHEDKNIDPVSPIAAAVVLGDKTDVRHERLRTENTMDLDKHSKVISACRKSDVVVNKEEKTIALLLTIDTNICSVMDYFEIFMSRTIFCKKASKVLGCNFELYINKDKFL